MERWALISGLKETLSSMSRFNGIYKPPVG